VGDVRCNAAVEAEFALPQEVPVDQAEYVAFLARAGEARTIAELRALATEVRSTHRNDADADRVDDVCQLYAVEMVGRLREGRTRRSGERGVPPDYTERAYR
jgi:hypothetical protein